MRPDPETISLGGKSWLIRPLTLRQVRAIIPLTNDLMSGKSDPITGIVSIVSEALRRGYAEDADPEKLLDPETSRQELESAMAVIMALSGLP